MLKPMFDLQSQAELVDENGVEMKSKAYRIENGGAGGILNCGARRRRSESSDHGGLEGRIPRERMFEKEEREGAWKSGCIYDSLIPTAPR